ncbi:MAG: hypothetical protein ACFN22_03435, partial [Porphyromonas pasteri]
YLEAMLDDFIDQSADYVKASRFFHREAFKTTCVDRGRPLREGAFFFTRTKLFLPLDKRDTRDKAKGLRVTLERSVENFLTSLRVVSCVIQMFALPLHPF